ncbi:MAG: MerR family transcriptional regulator [Euzebya sp.]
MRTVSEVAELAGVTIRTLHHYDEIGLLIPSNRTPAGYRMYDREDLRRLQQILFWRALGTPLTEIQAVLDDPAYDRVQVLTRQRAVLAEQVGQASRMLKAVDAALEEAQGGKTVSESEMFEAFDNAEYAEEAEARWGETDAWRQSQERTKNLTDQDKARIAREGIEHARRLADAMTSGVAADSAQGMDLAEEARLSIDRQFYDCPKEMHVHLGQMYVDDPRFTKYYDQHAEGLAVWFRDAIVANSRR